MATREAFVNQQENGIFELGEGVPEVVKAQLELESCRPDTGRWKFWVKQRDTLLAGLSDREKRMLRAIGGVLITLGSS